MTTPRLHHDGARHARSRAAAVLPDLTGEERPGSGRLQVTTTFATSPGTGALFAMQDTPWDHGLKVTADGNGLVGHAGAVLLRLAADRTGLTGGLGPALAQPRKSPQVDRGVALVSTAAAIALGATSMSDIEVLSQLEPVLGAPPSDTTVRRTLELADRRTLARAARAR